MDSPPVRSTWNAGVVLAVVIVMVWFGGHVYGWVLNFAAVLWKAGQEASPLVRPIWVCAAWYVRWFGEPLLLVVAFLGLEMAAGRRLQVTHSQLCTWACFFLVFAIHQSVSMPLAGWLLGWLPHRALDLAVYSPGLQGTGVGNVLNFLVLVVLTDFGLYWFHRLSHEVRFLWRFHAVHHSYEDLNALSSLFHPLDLALRLILVQFPLMLLMNYDESRLPWFVAGFYFVHDRFVHTCAPVGFGWCSWILCDNRLHFVHHSRDPAHQRKNFAALFPVFDMLYGTWFPAPAGALVATGLREHHEPRTVGAFLTGHLDPRLQDPVEMPPVAGMRALSESDAAGPEMKSIADPAVQEHSVEETSLTRESSS